MAGEIRRGAAVAIERADRSGGREHSPGTYRCCALRGAAAGGPRLPRSRLRLLHEAERLGAPAVASELLQLDAVSGRSAWEIEAPATVPCHQLVRAVGECDGLPLLVASARPIPQLDRHTVAGGARASRDIQHQALGVAADDAVVAAV